MNLFEKLARACERAKEVVLVAPFARQSTIERLPLKNVESLALFVRGTFADFSSGASDLELIRYINDMNGKVYVCHALHAKYYRADKTILIGSANLTARGLGLAGALSNFEILCSPPDDFDADHFEREILRLSVMVTSQFRVVLDTNLGELKRNGLSVPSPDVLVDWMPHATNPMYLWDAYRGEANHVPVAEQRLAANMDLQVLSLPDGLSKLALDAWLRAILLTAPATARLLTKFVSEGGEIPPTLERDSPEGRTLSWWIQLNARSF